MKKIMIMITFIFSLSSCDLTSPDRFDSDMLVIAGYLQAGKSITAENPIWIGKTTPVDGSNFMDVFINDAAVTLIDEVDSVSFDLSCLEFEGVSLYCNYDITIEAGKTYRLDVEAMIDSQLVHAYAVTTVPDFMHINMDYHDLANDQLGFADEFPDVFPAVPFDRINDDFPAYCRLDNADAVYSYYNFYCLEEFSTDLEYTQPFMGYTNPDPENEDDYYSPLGYNLRETNMLWKYLPLQAEDHFYLLNDYYANGFTFYGKYRLTIYSVDLNFYTYKYHSESYLHGGIEGGIGYFGSVSGEDFFTEITK